MCSVMWKCFTRLHAKVIGECNEAQGLQKDENKANSFSLPLCFTKSCDKDAHQLISQVTENATDAILCHWDVHCESLAILLCVSVFLVYLTLSLLFIRLVQGTRDESVTKNNSLQSYSFSLFLSLVRSFFSPAFHFLLWWFATAAVFVSFASVCCSEIHFRSLFFLSLCVSLWLKVALP